MPANTSAPLPLVKVAAAQAAPVFLDLAASLEKACRLIAQAAGQGARLIVFPEAFLPAYPDWIWSVPAREKKMLNDLYAELLRNSVAVPDETTGALCRAARASRINVAMGLNERNAEASGTSLYNTLLYISDRGEILARHRKLVPTGGERLIWAQGDGHALQVAQTSVGTVGGLICWENYMPLARYSMYAWGARIYLAPTWDQSEVWLATLRHIAKEGRVHVLGCCMALKLDDVPDRYEFKKLYGGREWINAGRSAILDPEGSFLAGPVEKKEEILYAELDPNATAGPSWMLDTAGHYARPDVFQLTVQRAEQPMIRVQEPRAGEGI